MNQRISDNRGFTLVEILVVLALTMIIMGLVLIPLVQSFKLTRRAEVMVRAQDDARLALSLISRDLAYAMYVYDNTKHPMDFPVVDQDGNPITVTVPYARVDLVLPRMRAYCTSPDHTPGVAREYPTHYVDPTGKENVLLDEAAPTCPEDGSPLQLRPIEPLAPDTKIVRYFVGLKDPAKPYSNGYTHKLTAAEEDNLYVLYRVEFSPSDPDLFENTGPGDLENNINDGSFFYNLNVSGFGETYAEAWRKISRPIVTLDGTDLVRIKYVDYEGVVVTIVTPTVRFEPTAIYNDPLVPTSESADDPEHGDTPPTVFKASYGHWVLPYEISVKPDETLP
ncbi:MAG TPA: prepilin-type N-terminal cleavage/methylation domain-containing protein, partial [Armatimonadota bacterium]|nr:prepilin-type N-terminal cleavage/methylation domain-containing protein [Armatimonadota bacterium]